MVTALNDSITIQIVASLKLLQLLLGPIQFYCLLLAYLKYNWQTTRLALILFNSISVYILHDSQNQTHYYIVYCIRNTNVGNCNTNFVEI